LEQWQWVWEVSVEKLPSDSLVEHNRSCLSSIFLGDIEGVWCLAKYFFVRYSILFVTTLRLLCNNLSFCNNELSGLNIQYTR